jgi:hypothetical protein
VQALERDIRALVTAWNDNPIPFVWTKIAEQILQSIHRLMKRINGAGLDPLDHEFTCGQADLRNQETRDHTHSAAGQTRPNRSCQVVPDNPAQPITHLTIG